MNSTADSGGSGFTMSAINSPTLVTGAFGDANGAYNFNGNTTTPQYLTRSSVTQLDTTDNFSLSARIYPTAYQATNYFGLTNGIICKGPATTYNWAMQLSSDTSLAFVKRTGAEGLQYRTFNSLPSFLNKWTTVTMTVTGGFVNLYLNGVYTHQIGVSNIAPGTNDMIIIGAMGGGTGTSVTAFIGSIDDVRVYDHVLNEFEARLIHEQGERAMINFFAF